MLDRMRRIVGTTIVAPGILFGLSIVPRRPIAT
jgi:hypothetical protein